MGKAFSRRSRRIQEGENHYDPFSGQAHPRRGVAPISALTEAQGHYLMSLDSNIVTFGVGFAGTGKTWIAAAKAAEALESGKVNGIVVTRPAVEAGRGIGFLKGDLEEKFAPWFAPVRKVLDERLGASHVNNLIRSGKIEVLPLEFMRGHTFDNKFVILDEAQNVDAAQMKMFLTRIGKFSRIAINGDTRQSDLGVTCNGLEDAILRLQDVNSVGTIEFAIEDVVRSGIVKEILTAYAR